MAPKMCGAGSAIQDQGGYTSGNASEDASTAARVRSSLGCIPLGSSIFRSRKSEDSVPEAHARSQPPRDCVATFPNVSGFPIFTSGRGGHAEGRGGFGCLFEGPSEAQTPEGLEAQRPPLPL